MFAGTVWTTVVAGGVVVFVVMVVTVRVVTVPGAPATAVALSPLTVFTVPSGRMTVVLDERVMEPLGVMVVVAPFASVVVVPTAATVDGCVVVVVVVVLYGGATAGFTLVSLTVVLLL
jgi:hypothetical protein